MHKEFSEIRAFPGNSQQIAGLTCLFHFCLYI